MTTRITLPRLIGRRAILLFIVILLVAVAAYRARPPSSMTIETGPVGGSYHQVALQYKDALGKRGITVNVVPKPNSMEIVKDVADPNTDVDVGFIAQDVSGMAGEAIATIGQIQLQPLFIFASADLGRRSTMDDLRGKRIVMPPEDSATSAAAVRVLALYDITDENTSFTFMPLGDAAAQLQDDKFDAGVFMLAPENPTIKKLASDSSLRLMPYTEARAVANHLPFLRPVVLPRGIYNIADAIPPYDTPLVAATVGVVIRDNLHPYLIYSLMDAMTVLHRPPTFLSGAGEFPTLAGAQLTAHPIAMDYYKAGLPWVYRDLPPWIASMVDTYDTYGLALLLICAVFVFIGPIADMLAAAFEVVALSIVARIDRRVTRTGRLTHHQTRMLGLAEAILRRVETGHAGEQVIADIRARASQA